MKSVSLILVVVLAFACQFSFGLEQPDTRAQLHEKHADIRAGEHQHTRGLQEEESECAEYESTEFICDLVCGILSDLPLIGGLGELVCSFWSIIDPLISGFLDDDDDDDEEEATTGGTE